MAGFFDCSFARVAVKLSFQNANGKPVMDKADRLNNYLRRFEDHEDSFGVSLHAFTAKSKVLIRSFNLWKNDKEKKEKYMDHFSEKAC